MKYSIFSTSNANGVEGKKRCIYEDVLKDFKHIYTFEYLIEFFEKKAQEYFDLSVTDDEISYGLKPGTVDFSCRDNYFSVLQIVWVIKTLKLFHDRGYKFGITNIFSIHDGWIMNIYINDSNLTKEQREIIYLNAFEQNQLSPNNIIG